MKHKYVIFISLMALVALLVTACGAASAPAPAEKAAPPQESAAPAQAAAIPTQEPAAPAQAAAPGNKVKIRWYVGLGAGSDEPTLKPQQKLVEEFNASQDKIELLLEIVDAASASDTLATQIAAGNAPDIVGPVGIRGRDSFKGAWLDLQPMVTQTNYDLSDFDPAMVNFYHDGDQLFGLPFAIFPSFLYVNLDLFDEAGLPYPPQKYGAPYIDKDGKEKPWNIDTLEELALKLTVDANGNDATSPNFDLKKIVQFGYGEQFADTRGMPTLFGSGSLVDEQGNAQIPDHWRKAWHWMYDGMWKKGFYPNKIYGDSDLLGKDNWFQSGNLAMAHVHLWYTCCIGELKDRWDLAVVPAYNGKVTAKMHADTFEIMKGTQHPKEAFEVLTYLLSPEVSKKLTAIYGGMPARLSQQDTYLKDFSAEKFPDRKINWQVARDSISYADNPNHESYMPNFLEANDRCTIFWNKIRNEPGLDLDAEIDQFQADLQRIFKEAKAK